MSPIVLVPVSSISAIFFCFCCKFPSQYLQLMPLVIELGYVCKVVGYLGSFCPFLNDLTKNNFVLFGPDTYFFKMLPMV